jgi:hypothetical protein
MSWEKLLVVVGVLAVIAVLAALLWPRLKHRAIYPGGVLTEAMSHPSMHGLEGAEEVWLEAGDGVRIHAWWVPAREDAPSRGSVLYAHGNAETMATRAWIADRLRRRGFDVLMFDYRGYGLSEGRASGVGLARDARAAWRHVVGERSVAPDRVVLMGHSLGSAVVTRLALEVEAGEAAGDGPGAADTGPAALVVGSPFPDMPTLFRHHAPWLPGFALRWRDDMHAAGSRLGRVDAPVLVLIATEDDVIPPAISRRVVEAAGEVRVVTAPTDHASLMAHDRVWQALEAFLADPD